MKKTLTSPTMLSLLPVKTQAKIVELQPLPNEEDFGIRLAHLGILPGEFIQIIRKAPLFGDPIIVEFRGCQMAMTLLEAQAIIVSA